MVGNASALLRGSAGGDGEDEESDEGLGLGDNLGFTVGIRMGEALFPSGDGKDAKAIKGDREEGVGLLSTDGGRWKGDLLLFLGVPGGDIPDDRSRAPLQSRRTMDPSLPIGTSFRTVVIFRPVFCLGSGTAIGSFGRGGALISISLGNFLCVLEDLGDVSGLVETLGDSFDLLGDG